MQFQVTTVWMALRCPQNSPAPVVHTTMTLVWGQSLSASPAWEGITAQPLQSTPTYHVERATTAGQGPKQLPPCRTLMPMNVQWATIVQSSPQSQPNAQREHTPTRQDWWIWLTAHLVLWVIFVAPYHWYLRFVCLKFLVCIDQYYWSTCTYCFCRLVLWHHRIDSSCRTLLSRLLLCDRIWQYCSCNLPSRQILPRG